MTVWVLTGNKGKSMSNLLDMRGNQFHQGCKVARALDQGVLVIQTVTRIENGKLYLDKSNQPIRFPKALLIIEQDPLFKMVNDYKQV